MKKYLTVWFIVLALILSGCGGSEPKGTTAAPAKESESQPEGTGTQTHDAGAQNESAEPQTADAESQTRETGGPDGADAQTTADVQPDRAGDISALVPAYSFYYEMEERPIRLNRYAELIPLTGTQWRELKDVITGEPAWYTCIQYEWSDEVNLYGDRKGAARSRLYSLDGELVCDWVPYVYTVACSGYVVRSEYTDVGTYDGSDIDCALWDPVKQADAVTGVYNVIRVNDSCAICADTDFGLMCRLYTDGRMDFSRPEGAGLRYVYVDGGYIFGTISDDSGAHIYTVCDSDLNVLLRSEPGSYLSLDEAAFRGPYVLMNNQDMYAPRAVVYDLNTGEEVYAADGYVSYFDGERGIHATADMKTSLTDAEGTPVSGLYDEIMAVDPEGPSQLFLAKNRAEDGVITACMLDRDGKVLREYSEERLIGIYPESGRVICQYDTPDPDDWEYIYSMMDTEFNELIPASAGYTYIYDLTRANNIQDRPTVWKADLGMGGRRSHDLYDADIHVILSRAADIGSADEAGIAVAKGFDYGIIDYSGSWIARASRYSGWGSD